MSYNKEFDLHVKDNKFINMTIFIVPSENYLVDCTYHSCTFIQPDFEDSHTSKDYSNITFLRCSFYNCRFERIMYNNSRYESCYIERSIFEQCLADIQFIKSDLAECSLNACANQAISFREYLYFPNISNIPTINTRSNAKLLFEDCNFVTINLNNCIFNNLSFRDSNNIIIYVESDCSFDIFEYVNSKDNLNRIENFFIQFAPNTNCKVTTSTKFPTWRELKKLKYVKEAISKKSDKGDPYYAMQSAYYGIASIFKENNLFYEYSNYYYAAKKLEEQILEKPAYFKSKIIDLFCGYGEKWWRGIFVSLFFIASFAFVFMFGLSVNSDYSIEYRLSFSKELLTYKSISTFIYDYWNCLYFSMMTFTTVGYGNMLATNFITQLFSFIEMFFGVIVIAITTGSLLRRMIR